MKPLMQLAAVGVAGVVLWKVLGLLLIPLLGTVLGFMFVVVKIALIVGAVFLVMRVLRKKKSGEAPATN